MKRFIILFTFLHSIFSQNTVTVLTYKSDSKLRLFELDFINQVIKLYNVKNKNKLSIKIHSERSYAKIFKMIESSKQTKYICAIRSLTITDKREKKYDFSYPYMPIKQVLMTKKQYKTGIKNWKNSKHIIYGNPNTVHFENVKMLSDKYGIKVYKPKDPEINIISYLNNGEIDFYVGDMTDIFVIDDIEILSEFDGALLSHYGIMFPKNSILKEKLNRYIKYLAKSPIYYKIVFKHFGRNIADYFKTLSEDQKNAPKLGK